MLRPGRPAGKRPARLALRSPRRQQQQQQQQLQQQQQQQETPRKAEAPRFLCEVIVDGCTREDDDENLRELTAEARAAVAARPGQQRSNGAVSETEDGKDDAALAQDMLFWRKVLERSEISARPDQLGPGNVLQAASALAVLGALSQSTLQIGGHLGRSILQDLAHAIFRKDLLHSVVNRCLDAVKDDGSEGSNLFETIQFVVARAGQANFYALSTERLSHKRDLLRGEIERWNSLEATMQKEILKKQMLMEKTAKRWQKSLLTSMFRVWKSATAARRKQRELLNACFARVSKSKAKQIFQAWKRTAAESKRARALEEIREIDARYNALQASKRELDLQIKRAAEDVSEWNQRVNELHTEMADLRGRIEESREDAEPQVLRHANAKRVAAAWFELCNAIILQEIRALEAQLDEVRETDFVDLELIVTDASELDAVSEMPLDDLLLRWVRLHVPGERVENFASDMADGVVLWRLLQAVRPLGVIELEAIEAEYASEEPRQAVAAVLRELPPLRGLRLGAVWEGASDVAFCVVAYLFCNFPTLTRRQPVWDDCRALLKNASLEQETLDDYLARNSIYDLRHEATWTSLVQRTEETRRKVRWCLRERDQKTGLWNTIHKRVQTVAWVLLLERLRGGAVPVPDHKEESLLQEFTVLDGYANSKREDEALGSILLANYELLRTMFNYYRGKTLMLIETRKRPTVQSFGVVLLCRDAGLDAVLSYARVFEIVSELAGDALSPISPAAFVRCLLRVGDEMYKGLSPATNLTRFIEERLSPLQGFWESQLVSAQSLSSARGAHESTGRANQGDKHASMRRRRRLAPSLMRLPSAKSARIRLRRAVWHDGKVLATLRQDKDRLASIFLGVCEPQTVPQEACQAPSATFATVMEHLAPCLPPGADLTAEFAASLELEDSSLIFFGDFCEILVALAAHLAPNPLVPFQTRLKETLASLPSRLSGQAASSKDLDRVKVSL